MKKIDFNKAIKTVEEFTKKNSPALLTGISVAGLITTAFLTGKATIKAVQLIQEREVDESKPQLTKKEIVATCWKCYVPVVITGTLSAACVIGANSVSTRRNAALATAYKITETAFAEYKQQVIETVGDKKERLIKHKVSEKKIRDNPVPEKDDKKSIIITGYGEQLCYDCLSDRYFKSEMEEIRKVENLINKKMINENYISLNEYYSEIGLPPIDRTGEDLGWSIDDGMIEFDIGTQLASNGKSCLTVEFNRPPKYEYNKFA